MQPQSSSSGASSSSRAGGPSGPTSGSQDIPMSSATSRTAAEIGEQPSTHAAATMGEKVRSGVDRATESMSQAAREAQETAAKAGHYVKDEAASMAEQQKEAAAKQMTHMSQAIRRAADKLHAEEDHRIAGYAERAASQMESASRYLAEH